MLANVQHLASLARSAVLAVSLLLLCCTPFAALSGTQAADSAYTDARNRTAALQSIDALSRWSVFAPTRFTDIGADLPPLAQARASLGRL